MVAVVRRSPLTLIAFSLGLITDSAFGQCPALTVNCAGAANNQTTPRYGPSTGWNPTPQYPTPPPTYGPSNSPSPSYGTTGYNPSGYSPSYGVPGNPPNPYARPTQEQTRAYLDSIPQFRGLDEIYKKNVMNGGFNNGAGVQWLSLPYLPNGSQNPLYQNGTVTPNWYIPATWTSGVNWQGVSANGSPSPAFNSLNIPWSSYTSTPSYTTTPNNQTYTPPPRPEPPPQTSLPSRTQPSQQMTKTPIESPHSSGPSPAEVKKAMDDHQHALELSETAGDKVGQAINHSALAEMFVYKSDPTKAFDHLSAAEPTVRNSSNPKVQMNFFRVKGAAHLSSGQFDEAITAFRQSMAIAHALDDSNIEGEILASIGWAYQSQGQSLNALKHYEQAVPLFAKSGNKEGEGRTRLALGWLYQSLGEASKASEQYGTLRSVASPVQWAAALSNVAVFYQSHNEFEKALMRYEAAIKNIRTTGDRATEAGVLAGMGRCYMGLGQFRKAQELFEQARILMVESGNRAGEAGVVASIGEIHFQDGISLSESNSRRAQFSQALKLYDQALSFMRTAGNRAGEIGVLTNIGLVYDAWGKTPQALNYYMSALDKMDELQAYSRIEEFRMDLAEQSANLYRRAILLKVRLNEIKDAFNLTERARARTFLDQLGNKRIDIRNHITAEFSLKEQELRRDNVSLERQLGQELSKPGFEVNQERVRSLELKLSVVRTQYENLLTRLKSSNPDYASFLSISPITAAEAQHHLAPDVTVVSYFITPDLTMAFVLTREDIRCVKIHVTEWELESALTTFRDFSGGDEASPSLKQLDKWLIAPIKHLLKTSVIGFVPHGILHSLSFAALTPNGRQYLGDDYEMFSLPSVSALPYVMARQKLASDRVLVLANDTVEGLPQLNHTYTEAKAVAALFDTQPRLGPSSTASSLRTDAGDHGIVHIVGHMEQNSVNPQFSSVMLASDEMIEPLQLHQIYDLDLRRTGLVVLSGCDSDRGKQSRGDDVLALSRAFLYAGASSVLASLWSVDDAATQELMIAFYAHLRQSSSKIEALRAAQLEIRRKYPHPYYWAGFVLTGNPGMTTGSGVLSRSDHLRTARRQ